MNVVLDWLARQAFALYLVCLIGFAIYVVAAITARRRRAAAQFSLEREVTERQIRRSWIMAGLFLLLGVLIFLISSYLVPALPAMETATPPLEAGLTPQPPVTATPTMTPTQSLPTLTPTPLGEAVEGEATQPPEEEITPTPTPVTPTPLPTAEPPNCPSPDVQIISPATGSTLTEDLVEVRGTATINSFAYYKFEVQFPGSDTPNFIEQFDSPVENGVLGYWDISNATSYPSGGPYRFRLVAVDIYGNTQNCVIPVYINQQP